jgi:multiple sugar transport system substrate-binding protein
MMFRASTFRLATIAIALALAAGLALWLRPQADASAQAPVTIRFWNGFTGPDGRTMLRMVQQFNRENPDIRVTMQRMDWGTYYNKLFVAGLGGRAPEIYVAHSDVLPRLYRAGLLRLIDDLIEQGGVDIDDFDANVWQAVQFGGRPVALPLDVHPMGLYYNTELFRRAGIVDEHGEARPPVDAEQFVDALRKLRTGDQWGFVYTWLRTNTYAIMQQFGGQAFNDDFSRCTLDDPANVRALEFCVDLIQQGLVAPPRNIDSWIGFRQGRVGMVFDGIYMLPDLQRQGNLPYAGAPLPQLGDRPATWASSHSLCLRPDLDDRRLEASWRFLRFLSDRSLDWAEGGQVPVRKSLRQTGRFEAMTIQRRFAEQIPYIRYRPRVPFIFEFDSEFDLAVQEALNGSAPARQSLEKATRRINAVIERDRRMYQHAEVPR